MTYHAPFLQFIRGHPPNTRCVISHPTDQFFAYRFHYPLVFLYSTGRCNKMVRIGWFLTFYSELYAPFLKFTCCHLRPTDQFFTHRFHYPLASLYFTGRCKKMVRIGYLLSFFSDLYALFLQFTCHHLQNLRLGISHPTDRFLTRLSHCPLSLHYPTGHCKRTVRIGCDLTYLL